jgi:hypothetical protein
VNAYRQRESIMNYDGGENVKAEKCIECGEWAEPPFKSIVCWVVPAIVADAAVEFPTNCGHGVKG